MNVGDLVDILQTYPRAREVKIQVVIPNPPEEWEDASEEDMLVGNGEILANVRISGLTVTNPSVLYLVGEKVYPED